MYAFGVEVASEAVCLLDDGLSKHEALDRLVDVVMGLGAVTDRGAFRRAVYQRELVQSTGLGGGVAVPHVRIAQALRPTLAVAVSKKGIEFDSLDGKPVHVLVMFAMPAGAHADYLDLLAQVMLALKSPGFLERLVASEKPDDLTAVLNDFGPRGQGGTS